MLAAYGYELKAKDEYVDAINAFETAVIQIFEVGFLVDLFPICKSIFYTSHFLRSEYRIQ